MERIDKSPYKDRIEYKGFLDDKSYYSTLNAVDIPCMTRVDIPFAHAGFPFKLGEYLASGKPVIASNVSDVESLLQDRCDVILVRPDNISDIISAVEFILAHPEKAVSIGENGRKTAKKNFDHKPQGIKLISFMEQV